MKTLIQMELKANFKIAVAGLVVFLMLTIGTWVYREGFSQPLLSVPFLLAAGWFCGMLGAVLGWVQIFNERHRDLWAFLVHRPESRTRIFLSKVVAGLVLYGLAAGVPLGSFALWCSVPGHVAAPFEWGMALPVLGFLLGGIGFYFAGMLTALRRTRWYGSRTLGLGMAFIGELVFIALSWQNALALVSLLAFVAVLAVAAWGSFQTNGQYRGQLAAAKLALSLSISGGVLVVMIFGFFVCAYLLLNGPVEYSNYTLTRDGTIYLENYHSGHAAEYSDLDGKPPVDLQTGRPLSQSEIVAQLNPANTVRVDFSGKEPPRMGDNVMGSNKYFTPLWSDSNTIWYYWRKNGRAVAYDTHTRRLVGSLGPNGFANGADGAGDRFCTDQLSLIYWLNLTDSPRKVLRTATSVFMADLAQRTVRTVFTVPAGETIGGYEYSGQPYLVVVTRPFIYLVGIDDGKLRWKTPYDPGYPDYGTLRFSRLGMINAFTVWFVPEEDKLPIRVKRLANDGSVIKSVDLPNLPAQQNVNVMLQNLSELLMLPLVVAISGLFGAPGISKALATASVCVVLGLWLGRRYNFAVKQQMGWALFHLLFGLPGFLAFVSVQEWPARVKCPKCQKLRVVDREYCEHCQSTFAPPEKTGIEIFEPAVAKQY